MYHWEERQTGASNTGFMQKSLNHDKEKSLKDRASDTLHELKEMMMTSEAQQANHELLVNSVNPRLLVYSSTSEPDGSSLKATEAALKLQQLLSQQSSRVKIPSPGKPLDASNHIPSPQETSLLLQTHSQHTKQLEAESNYLKEEMRNMKMKMKEVADENHRLHEELRKSFLQDVLQEMPNRMSGDHMAVSPERDVFEQVSGHGTMKKWKKELARLHEMHDAKSSQLEAQLLSAKAEISRCENVIEQLKSDQRIKDSNIATHEDGSVEIAERHAARVQQERDELANNLSALKIRLKEGIEREESLMAQVKRGIELLEEAHLHETQVTIEKEQLQSQLENMKGRFERMTETHTRTLESEKDAVRKQSSMIVSQLETKVKEVTEQLISTQLKLDTALADRSAAAKALEDCRSEIKLIRREASQISLSQKTENSQLYLIRQQSTQEVARLNAELVQERHDMDQERCRIRTEKAELHRRLEQTERDQVETKEECIHLTSQIQSLERELHFAKMAKDSVEQCRKSDLDLATHRCQHREQELQNVITDMESKHAEIESQMDELVRKQNKLITKLREECYRLSAHLESLTKRYRTEVGEVRRENDVLKQKLESSLSRCDNTEMLNQQHCKVKAEMVDRLKMMDTHAQKQAQQILDLLNKQAEMMRQRQALAKEVELLRSKLGSYPQPGGVMANQPISNSMAAIDQILSQVIHDKTADIIEQYKPIEYSNDRLEK